MRNGYISAEAARVDYGVSVDTAHWRVDDAATERLRADMNAARGDGLLPTISWTDAADGGRAGERS